jgi:hypothetical protein
MEQRQETLHMQSVSHLPWTYLIRRLFTGACVPAPFPHLWPSHIGFVALLRPPQPNRTASKQHSQPLSHSSSGARTRQPRSLGAFAGYEGVGTNPILFHLVCSGTTLDDISSEMSIVAIWYFSLVRTKSTTAIIIWYVPLVKSNTKRLVNPYILCYAFGRPVVSTRVISVERSSRDGKRQQN